MDDELINNSLDDVIVLLEREIERLKESLETIRLSTHPDRAQLSAGTSRRSTNGRTRSSR